MIAQQLTLKGPLSFQGVALHSGLSVQMTLKPAPADHGLIFQRMDLPSRPQIPALAESVTDTQLCTVLAKGDAQVGTVEHLLAAVHAFGIDNLLIEVDGPELPVLDGSALAYCLSFHEVGLDVCDVVKRWCQVLKPIAIQDGDKWAKLLPIESDAPTWQAKVALNYPDDPFFSTQPTTYEWSGDASAFTQQVALARTYCHQKDVDYMRSLGLAQGGSLENAVVIQADQVLNPEGLRVQGECARHKLLDAMGDLRLVGTLWARYEAFMPGHGLNNQLARALLAQPDAWQWVHAH